MARVRGAPTCLMLLLSVGQILNNRAERPRMIDNRTNNKPIDLGEMRATIIVTNVRHQHYTVL